MLLRHSVQPTSPTLGKWEGCGQKKPPTHQNMTPPGRDMCCKRDIVRTVMLLQRIRPRSALSPPPTFYNRSTGEATTSHCGQILTGK